MALKIFEQAKYINRRPLERENPVDCLSLIIPPGPCVSLPYNPKKNIFKEIVALLLSMLNNMDLWFSIYSQYLNPLLCVITVNVH